MTALAVSNQSVLKKTTVEAIRWAETRLGILLDIDSAQGHYIGLGRTPNTHFLPIKPWRHYGMVQRVTRDG